MLFLKYLDDLEAQESDVFDVLAYIAFALPTVTRQERADIAKDPISSTYDYRVQSFLDFVLAQYVRGGVGELDRSKLPTLLELKYGSTNGAASELGDVTAITDSFVSFQKYLYEERVQ